MTSLNHKSTKCQGQDSSIGCGPSEAIFFSREVLGKTAMQQCNQLLDSILYIHTHTFQDDHTKIKLDESRYSPLQVNLTAHSKVCVDFLKSLALGFFFISLIFNIVFSY